MQNQSGWLVFIASDASGNFNTIFRIGIGFVLLPHCMEELQLLEDRLSHYGKHSESMASGMIGLHYFIMLTEVVFAILLCIGLIGKLSASFLGVSISLHFLPLEENMLGLFLFNYPVYSLLYPVLFFLILTGSGPYSIDAIILKFRSRKTLKR